MELDALVELSQSAGTSLGDLTKKQGDLGRAAKQIFASSVEASIREILMDGSKRMQAVAKKLSVDAGAVADDGDFTQTALEALKSQGAGEAVLKEAAALLKGNGIKREYARPNVPARAVPVKNKDVLVTDKSSAHLPAVDRLVELGAGVRIGKTVGLDDRHLARMVSAGVSVGKPIPGGAQALADQKIIPRNQVAKVDALNTVARLVDGEAAIMEKLASRLSEPTSGAELVALSAKEWAGLAGSREGNAILSDDDWGKLVEARVAATFPVLAIGKDIRVQKKTVSEDTKVLEKAGADLGEGIFTSPALSADQLSKLGNQAGAVEAAHARVRRLDGQYPGLNLAKTLQDGDGNLAKRVGRVDKLAAAAGGFMVRNQDFLSMDLSAGSADIRKLDFGGVDRGDKPAVLNFAKTYQRIHAVAGTPALTTTLAGAGFNSALGIATGKLDGLVASGVMTKADADKIGAAAKDIAPGVIGVFGGILNGHKEWFDNLPFGAQPTGLKKMLKDIPGYESYFGSQDFCDCAHCRSILGPAAYFVDLMRFVEEHISDDVFAAKPDHVLNLKVRRPDLWALELTCENTNKLLPILQIVCEVVEAYLAKELGFAGPEADKQTFVYKTTLANTVDSFYQPYVRPIQELGIFLSHDKITLRDVAETIRVTGAVRARMGLGLSKQELHEITTERKGLPFLRKVYGFHFKKTGTKIDAFEPHLIFAHTGLERDALGRAIETQFVTENGVHAVEIKGRKRSAESVQNDMEELNGADQGVLDRLRRLTLATRAIGWSFDEIDVAHAALVGSGRADADLTERTMGALVRLDDLMRHFNLPVDEAAVLVANIPERPIVEDGDSLMTRLFNMSPYDMAAPWPDNTVKVLLPAFAPEGTPVPAEAARLQSGLGLADEDMTHLVRALAPKLAVEPDAVDGAGQPDIAKRSLTMDMGTLTLLLRHACLAKSAKIKFSELAQVMLHAPGVGDLAVDGFDEIANLLDFVTYQKDSKRSADDISFIVGGTPADAASYPDAAALAQEIIDGIASDAALTFEPGIFTVVEGISEASSEAILTANGGLFESVADGYRVRPGYTSGSVITLPADDPASGIEIPADIRADAQPLHDLLASVHAPGVLSSRAAVALAARNEVFDTAVAMLGADLNSQAMFDSLSGQGAITEVETLLAEAAPLCMSMDADELTEDRLAFVDSHRATVFALGNAAAISVEALQRFDRYAVWAKTADKLDAGSALEDVLAAHNAANGFAGADADKLAELLECDVALANALQAAIHLPNDPFLALAALADGVKLSRKLAVGGATLGQMGSSDYDELATASEALQAGFRSRFPTQAIWEEQVEDLRDRVLSSRRDGLVNYMVASIGGQFETAEDLYRYFLIDAQMEGCGRTSRIVSANSTLQLYVQRVMMNLEETPEGHADPIHVPPTTVDADEWSWRKNYRVWEANRRVYIYPENYLLPELRDNKSELFEAFEETMASGTLNADTIRDAYAAYLRGFEDVSQLKISGAFLEKDDDDKHDVLHLFGVSADDPPRHFYRRVEDFWYGVTEATRATDWDTWREVDLKIPARKLSPIIHQGRLYVFWNEVSTTTRQKIKDGTSEFDGYNHKFRLMYSVRRLDGSWAEPQTLKLDQPPFYFGDGVVIDEPAALGVHYQNDVVHDEPIDGYTLTGFPWEQVYPEHMDKDRDTIIVRGMDYRVNGAVDFHKMRLGETITSGFDDVRVPWMDPLSAVFGMIFGAPLGFPSSNMLWSEMKSSDRVMFKGARPDWPFFLPFATGSLFIKIENYEEISENRTGYNYMYIGNGDKDAKVYDNWTAALTDWIDPLFTGPEVLRFDDFDPDLQVINGAPQHAIIDVEGALFALLDGAGDGGKYRLSRLNSTLAEDIAKTLFNQGVDAMLSIEAQEALGEHDLPMKAKSQHVDTAPTMVGEVDYSGPVGVYLQEIYFHLPLVIAKTLNAQGDYDEARSWFHKVFDPTASEEITNIPANLSDEDKERRKLDRVWQYRRFRGRDVTSMRDILEDEAALETYKRDPFNPHAIARTRTSAYQKYVVLAYVENLLDEADALFSTDLREQINEATLLYVTALDILGPRPRKLGDCGDKMDAGLTYASLEQHIADDDDMLLEIETNVINWAKQPGVMTTAKLGDLALRPGFAALDNVEIGAATKGKLGGKQFGTKREIEKMLRDPSVLDSVGLKHGVRDADYALAEAMAPKKAVGVKGPFGTTVGLKSRGSAMRSSGTNVGAVGAVMDGGAYSPGKGKDLPGLGKPSVAVPEKARLTGKYGVRKPSAHNDIIGGAKFIPGFGVSVLKSVSPVFCVPENDSLKKYWDRVEDRLFKIRNCMNIDGVKRPLALFAPPIDPLLLVRARAAGLSIDDVISASAGSLPPYRFRFLLDRARSTVAMAKSFGDAMQRALTSKDAEELAQLRNTHQANILKMGEELRKNDIKIAEEAIEELGLRKAMVEARQAHYADLISAGDLPSEIVQKIARIVSGRLKMVSTGFQAASAFASLIPDGGAPTTMEWGGSQISAALRGTGTSVSQVGDFADLVGMVAGMIASDERRYQGWAHQQSQALHELGTFEPREKSANIRLEMAEKNLAIHETQMEHQDEIIDFFGDKFTGLALYTHLASNMQKLFRQAMNLAQSYARLAETAYRFETGDDAFIVQGNYWDSSRAGLLAGEKLTMDLALLEQRYIEGRKRHMEVNQTFSLAQLDPGALMHIRNSGSANFSLPEWAFDLFYPGQYKRRIKAVRLTIPCVAGPYTNISATLSLTESQIRSEPDLANALVAAPQARDAMIASSTAQSDAGVFELNFRDERYLPFEGAGAISSWRLELPSTFKPFSYDTISDVLINISYEADYDAGLRADVEDTQNGLANSLDQIFQNASLTRVFSLRQDASAAYQRLFASPAGTEVDFEIKDTHFPLFVRGRTLTVSRSVLLIQTAEGEDASGAEFELNTKTADNFAADAGYGGLAAKDVASPFNAGLIGSQKIKVVDGDTLAGATGALGHDKVTDILIAVEYTVG